MDKYVSKTCRQEMDSFKTEINHEIYLKEEHEGLFEKEETPISSVESPSEGSLSREYRKALSQSHTAEKTFQCKYCTNRFINASRLIEHIEKHTDQNPYECDRCDEAFREPLRFARHVLAHQCEKTLNPIELVVKQEEMEGDVSEDCGQGLQNVDHLKTGITHENHMEEPADDNEESLFTPKLSSCALYVCEYCLVPFEDASGLIKHKKIHTGMSYFQCKHCLEKFDRVSKLNKHVKTHNIKKSFVCDRCPETFTDPSLYARHFLAHKKDTYKCIHCQKVFNNSSNLTRHLSKHTAKTPLNCSFCSKQFLYRSSLNIHLRSHSGDRPYSCNFCPKKFSQQGNFEKHLKTHKQKEKVF